MDLMSYDSKVAAGNSSFGPNEIAAYNKLQTLINAEGAKWQSDTFVAAEADGSFAVAAAGAFMALSAALF